MEQHQIEQAIQNTALALKPGEPDILNNLAGSKKLSLSVINYTSKGI